MRPLLLAAFVLTACQPDGPAPETDAGVFETALAGDTAQVAVYVVDPVGGFRLNRLGGERFHAASTMKIPVLIELARRVEAGEVEWGRLIPVRNQFASIVDGSPYSLRPQDDSDSSLYGREGTSVPAGELARLMIVRSSNLATNLLIAALGAPEVQATARRLGAGSMVILRGVEDGKAYAAGLNNTTTASDLAALLLAIADGTATGPVYRDSLLAILEAQEFNDGLPAGLPPGTRVAHKTGEITATYHDAALVWPTADEGPYALVMLTRGYGSREAAMAAMQRVARAAHAAVVATRARN